ncbi:hypothetical protein NQ314_004289 [Rhamnusium bicolor]|uniref:Cilia- and flagella-associated protein 58 central coiled coil domain-containing protein n=1 Tax=Rhamnusium bicolor TaxID=1586634 RepID=A0AAV8ZJH7_9CUCU|nr:hypothetical protein NQ314_004289 [Rhamnusium bicolor]
MKIVPDQTNFACDLRNILKSVFLINATDTTESAKTLETATLEASIEYHPSEDDVIENNEFSVDPNILAQEALFDTNVYFHLDTEDCPTSDYSNHPRQIQSDERSLNSLSSDLNRYASLREDIANLHTDVTHPETNGTTIHYEVQENYDRPPIWIPDVEAPKCMTCGANFTGGEKNLRAQLCGLGSNKFNFDCGFLKNNKFSMQRKTLIELEQNPEAAQFSDAYTNIFEAFYQAYTKQRHLEELTTTQKDDIEEKTYRLELAMKLADEDKQTIEDLKAQIHYSWKLADNAHAREQQAQEIIDNLRKQVENLNAEIEFKNKMAQDTEEESKEISKNKDGLERERDRLLNEDTGGEINRQKRAKEKLEAEMAEMRILIEDKAAQITELNTVINLHVKQTTHLEQEMKDYKMTYDKLAKDFEAATIRLTKLQDEYNNIGFAEEASRLKNDISKITKVRDGIEKKCQGLMADRDELIIDRNNLRIRISAFEKQIDEFKKYGDNDKRMIDTLIKEKEILSKTLQRQQGVQKDLNKLIQIQEQSKKKLEFELDLFFVESGKLKKTISGLERERDRLAEEQLDLTKTIEEHMEDIRLKKSATEQENKLRQQHNLYEAIRSDRNALQKSLQESTAETGELKKKLKIVFHQTEQLKEDIGMKEKLLVKDENMMRKINKEKENLKIEVMAGLDTIRTLKQDIKELAEEERRLHKTLMSNERTIRDQAKDLEQLMNERDILGSQLVRRNDEIALLQEKIVILQSTLFRGETQYGQRLEDIKLLKLEVKRLRQEKNLMSKSMSNMVDLRQEIFHLERDFTRSRLQCKALEQEIQNPLNVHRWRKLEGSDPEVLDLLQKVQILQKRLLQQASEAVERERQLKEAERLYLNLRQVLSKQPGPGIQEELTKTQRALKLRGDKLKCLVSELNMAELKSVEYKADLQRVTDELTDLKRKYLAEKKSKSHEAHAV